MSWLQSMKDFKRFKIDIVDLKMVWKVLQFKMSWCAM